MKLIVGLGNPGEQYEKTRHNAGFRTVDEFADLARIDVSREKFDGIYGSGTIKSETVILFKPLTFMNLSGTAVRKIVDFYKIDLSDILIVYDDMAVMPGNIRLRYVGSSGGHHGMQNIIEALGTSDLKRIRIGIGEPLGDGISYVLGKPRGEEADALENGIHRAAQAIKEYLLHSFNAAMSKYNGGGNV